MFAVIRTGSKQYKVQPNDVILVEKLEKAAGETVILEDVLLLGDGQTTHVGEAALKSAKVLATVEDQTRTPKVLIFKKKRRHKYRRKKGHRQHVTVLRIVDIALDGNVKNVPVKAAPKATTEKPAVSKAAAPKTAAAKKADTTAAPKKDAAKKAPAKAAPKAKKSEK